MMEWDGFLLSHFFSLISQAENANPTVILSWNLLSVMCQNSFFMSHHGRFSIKFVIKDIECHTMGWHYYVSYTIDYFFRCSHL